MTTAVYRLPDEPRPGALARFAVQPVLPLFAMMLAGGWLAWPWFVFNGRVLGSPTRHRELVVALAGFAGSVFVVWLGALLISLEILPKAQFKYWLLWLPAIKLASAFYLYLLQARVVGLYEHFGGKLAASGAFVLVAGFFIDAKLAPLLREIPGAGLLLWASLG